MTACTPPIDLVAWARQVLSRLGVPVSTSNLTLMVAWATAEGGHNVNDRRYNPLNSTLPMPGATNGGAQGNIKAYASYADGLTATVNNIAEPRYANIVAALKASADPAHIADLIGSPSPLDGLRWGTDGPFIKSLIGQSRAKVVAAGGGSAGGTVDPTLFANPDGSAAVDPATGAIATSIPGLPQPYDVALYTPLTYGPGHDAITVGYEPATDELLAALVSAKLSLSTTQVTQLELTFEDPQLRGISNGALGELGTLITYGPLNLVVEAVEFGGGGAGTGGITVTARPAGIAHLRNLKGPVTFQNMSPSDYAAACATLAGLHLVAQPSPARASIVVAAAPQTGGNPETYWDTLGRLATELGFLVYEAAGTLFFGQPSWIIATVPPLDVKWDAGDLRVELDDAGHVVYYRHPAPGGILAQPVVRRSTDTTTGKEVKDLTFELAPEMLRAKWSTGSKVSLSGVAFRADGEFLITGIDVDLASPESPAQITAAVTPDPAPQPPTDGSNTPPVDGGTAASSSSSTLTVGPGSTGPVVAPASPGQLLRCGPGGRWVHPTNGHGTDAHNFGQARAAGNGVPAHRHAGTDIAVPVGTPILAAFDGSIIVARDVSGYGYAVYINHPTGEQTRYGHLSKFAPGLERPADNAETPVRAGQVIGWSGGQPGTPGAGDATGPHLHYEIHKPINGPAVDPEPYLVPAR